MVIVNLNKYQILLKTVELGSITRAAEALGYTQSAVSRVIADLEREWDMELLTRSRTGVVLSSSGAALLPYVQAVCNAGRELEEQVAELHGPSSAACERVFLNVNPQSTLRLGEARGAALAAAAAAGLAVEEFTPSEIKEAVTGTGRADKIMIQTMVKRLLELDEAPRADAADALACALCALQSARLRALEKMGGTTRGYAVARRGNASRGARSAWTRFAEEGKTKK